MKDFSEVNFFTDPALVANPYPYYEYLRAQCPVVHVPSSGVVAVTGYDELTEVYRDSATFSAVNSSLGPFRCRSRSPVMTSPNRLRSTATGFR
jgi:cytochrome P450